MSDERPLRLDRLLSCTARTELLEAEQLWRSEGFYALAKHARSVLDEALARQALFERLTADVEAFPEQQPHLMAAYLRVTAPNPRAAERDIAALRRRDGLALDMSALADRLARQRAAAELVVEAALAVLCAAVGRWPLDPGEVEPVIALALQPGQWSRRVRALELLRRIARRLPHAHLRDVALVLASPAQHHWVQSAALALLATIDPLAGARRALARLKAPGGGDDLLVRERLVELARRRVIPRAQGRRLLARAMSDPSDHVRIAVARCRQTGSHLRRLARQDASHKVRATAIVTLSRAWRFSTPRRFRALVLEALARDPHPFVVLVAAETAARLARDGDRAGAALLAGIAGALGRSDLTAAARNRLAELQAEVSVLIDARLRKARDILARELHELGLAQQRFLARPELTMLDDRELGLVLVTLTSRDAALAVDRRRDGLIVYRGDFRSFAWWRLLFEVRHPRPSKRQAFAHTHGRVPRGELRAPPGCMAETTRTLVPGERVYSELAGGWGREFPLVDDLRSLDVWRARPVSLVTPAGTCVIVPPASLVARIRSWLKLTLNYAEFCELRSRSLESQDPEVRTAFSREVQRATGVQLRFTSGFTEPRTSRIFRATLSANTRASSAPPPAPEVPAPLSRALGVMPWSGGPTIWSSVREAVGDFATHSMSPERGRLSHLAIFAAVTLLAWAARAFMVRRGIERDRAAIPLIIGGWGTRGKSGTERLKAALFQGFGLECVVKTTGCEAMFIHAIPGTPAREIFLFRPYDKSTVWEQRDVMRLARRLQARVFLWECMALQPELVRLVERDWMKTTCSTITNAYPDHEDIQGPSGRDVADVISEFVPTRGTVYTAEDQMLPILRQKAERRHSRLVHVGAHRAELIADDLLSRFPYQEHPRNVALVARMAASFGIAPAVAIAELADNVVPDLGVLKTYPAIDVEGRKLTFTNGMSANERMGALSNWTRCGFDRHEPDRRPADWIVTLVNNRGDRLARSQVFARLIVEDTAAHRHVLIGTNVRALLGLIGRALDRYLVAINPMRDLPSDVHTRAQAVTERIDRAFLQLKIGSLTASSVVSEVVALGWRGLEHDVAERLLVPANPGETLAEASRAISEVVDAITDASSKPFLVAMLAKRRAVRALRAYAEANLASRPARVAEAFSQVYREIFFSQLVVIDDPRIGGDELIARAARITPPGARVAIVGLQNIKGTGLDFVYRWVSIEATARRVAGLNSRDAIARGRALRELSEHDDYGAFDARQALAALSMYEPGNERERHSKANLIARLSARATITSSASDRRGAKNVLLLVMFWLFDHLLMIGRQRRAGLITRALVNGSISRARAAVLMRDLVKVKD